MGTGTEIDIPFVRISPSLIPLPQNTAEGDRSGVRGGLGSGGVVCLPATSPKHRFYKGGM